MQTRFKFLTGDVNWLQYGAKWISPKLNNGEFDYWLVLELFNMDEACGRDNESQPTYNVCLSVVSPSEAGSDKLASAFECCGLAEEHQNNPVVQVECLHSYGVSTPLWQANGNNAHKLLRQAKHEAQLANMLFGFYMDKAVNRIGTTGWEAIKGDLTAGLARTIASGSTEGNILAKMHGVPPAAAS